MNRNEEVQVVKDGLAEELALIAILIKRVITLLIQALSKVDRIG